MGSLRIILILLNVTFMLPVLKASDSITVYLFLLDECRICQEIMPEINNIYDDFHQDIGFIGVFPNYASKENNIQKFKEKYRIKFQTKTDYFKTIAKKFEAKVLPEVIVYDEKNQEVLYRGAIHDLFLSPGKRKQRITHHYLREALQQITQHNRPKVVQTEAIGCFINYNDIFKSF